ncbi:rhodanese-like domain-containing protein [Oryzomonas japonica]|uniref:Rhodanese-like domain-containing protein n=1 Tax=Oryzomonas japonica TaxID=2603858 RepID=A0A7J4ZVV4_9BACT|nr:rhodanese-like domain-containing protein [Oryzomonas japonica]KAB0667717.1 rhodanese-like domain-containing protein [Oryzomonas japonica]
MQPQELLKRIKSKQPPSIIDVRSRFEFRTGHIPGAIHAPTWKILLKLARIPADKNAELVVTCEHGPRAQFARSVLEAFGYRKVALLPGHMVNWRQTGHPQEK